MRVMIAAAEAPGLASSINVGAFNLGNGGRGAGGGVISLGLGYAAIPVAGGLLAAGAAAAGWRAQQATNTIGEAA
jgi:DHA1 family inner membrane transport protein